MAKQSTSVAVSLCVATCFLAAGCGGGQKVEGVKVTGSVTQGGGGQAGVLVGFILLNQPAGGGNSRGAATDAQGNFEAVLLPGKYSVTLSKMVDTNGNPPPPDADVGQMIEDGQLREAMPPQYTDPASTPLSAEVPPEGKQLEPFVIQ
jgi:hypothetical protein